MKGGYLEARNLRSALVLFSLAAQAGGMDFCIAREERARRCENDRLISPHAARARIDNAPDDEDAVLASQPGKDLFVLARGILAGNAKIHGKPGGKHLRQDHQ